MSTSPLPIKVRYHVHLFIIVRCTPLCDPSSGYVNHSDNLVGSMAMYECDQEFVLSGPVYRLCQSDGTWSDIEPVCDPVGKYCWTFCLL